MKLGLLFLALSASVAAEASFHLLVTETPAGSVSSNQWMGVRRYNVSGTGGAAVIGNGIASPMVSDPAGLALSPTGELFVGNRHGNSAASSLSRFNYDSNTDTFISNGTVSGNSLFGTHGIVFSNNGDLFATNLNGPVSRFTYSGGVVTPNGTLGSGPSRDAFVSDNGQWLYVTQGVSGNLLKYDRATGNLMNTFSIAGAGGLHDGTWRGDELFIAGFSSGTVHRIGFDANGDVSASSIVATSSGPISVVFSPDEQEMFVAGHTSGVINRYSFGGGGWTQSGSINTGVNMGDMLVVVPEPATLAAIGIGVVAVLRRRRTQP